MIHCMFVDVLNITDGYLFMRTKIDATFASFQARMLALKRFQMIGTTGVQRNVFFLICNGYLAIARTVRRHLVWRSIVACGYSLIINWWSSVSWLRRSSGTELKYPCTEGFIRRIMPRGRTLPTPRAYQKLGHPGPRRKPRLDELLLPVCFTACEPRPAKMRRERPLEVGTDASPRA